MEKSCTIAINANMKRNNQATCKATRRRTLERKHIIAINVNMKQRIKQPGKTQEDALWRKKHRDAHCASIHASQPLSWTATWWGSIQERCHTIVTNATTLAILRTTYKGTWRCRGGETIQVQPLRKNFKTEKEPYNAFSDPPAFRLNRCCGLLWYITIKIYCGSTWCRISQTPVQANLFLWKINPFLHMGKGRLVGIFVNNSFNGEFKREKTKPFDVIW